MRTGLFSSFGTAIVATALCGGSVSAQDTAAAGQALMDSFAELCPVAIYRPEDAMAAALLRGYSSSTPTPSSAFMKAFGASTPDGRNLTVSVFDFSDHHSVTCQLMATTPVSLDQLKALRQKVEAIDSIGTVEGDFLLSPNENTDPVNMTIGSFKRPGHDPAIFLFIMTSSRFTNLTLNLAQPKPKN